MAKYTEKEILDSYSGRTTKTDTTQLRGNIFKKIVSDYLTKELDANSRLELKTSEFDKKGGRKIFLIVDNKILIEIRAKGYQFSEWNNKKDDERYKYIKIRAEESKCKLIYITGAETNQQKKGSKDYKRRTIQIFGRKHTFFLDEEGSWQKFVERVCDILQETK